MENEKYTYGMIEELLTEDISRIFAELNSSEAETNLTFNRVKIYNNPEKDGKIDLLLEYNSSNPQNKWTEDALFNAIAGEKLTFNGIPVDINPITPEKSGTIDEYLERLGKKDEIEITDRINSAFRIADSLYPELKKEFDGNHLLADELPQYSNEEKKAVINNAFEKIKSAFDEKKVRLSDSRTDELVFEGSNKWLLLGDFQVLIKGKDAAEHGKESLSYIRPNAEQLHDGIENGWKFDEITAGYAIFQNPDLDVKGGFTPKFISKLDDMNVFESDGDAAKQYGIDHNCRILEEKKDIWIGDEDLEYYSYPDIPENRRIMKENGWLLEQPLEFDFSEFTEKDFNRIRDELFKDNPKEDYYGRLHIGSLHVEFVINQNDGWVDTNYYILGEKGEGETQFGVPYDHFPGHQFASNLFTDNTYEEFKEKVKKAVLDDIAEEGTLKPEAMRPLVDWNDEQQCNELYHTKLIESAKSGTIDEYLERLGKLEKSKNVYEQLDLGQNMNKNDVIVKYAFQEYISEKELNERGIKGVSKILTYEEPRWTLKDTAAALKIIKEADSALYETIQSYIKEQHLPSENTLYLDFGKSLRYDDEYMGDFSKETLSDKLDNRFIVRYSHDNDDGNLIDGGDEIIINDKELVSLFNGMIEGHVKENIQKYDEYKIKREEIKHEHTNYIKEQLEKESGIKVNERLVDEIYSRYEERDLQLEPFDNGLFRITDTIDGKYTNLINIQDVVKQVIAWDDKELSELHDGTADDEEIKRIKDYIEDLEHVNDQIVYSHALTNLDFNNKEHVQKVKDMLGHDFKLTDEEAKVLLTYATHFDDGTHEYGLSKDGHLHFRTNQDNEGWSFLTEESMQMDFLTSAFDGAAILLDSDRTNDIDLLNSFLQKNESLLNELDNNRFYTLSLKDVKEKIKEIDMATKELTVTEKAFEEETVKNSSPKERYMLLSRMQSDCEYYLGNGNRNAKHLWAGEERQHIKNMVSLYNSFSFEDKPEWLTLEQLDNYSKELTGKSLAEHGWMKSIEENNVFQEVQTGENQKQKFILDKLAAAGIEVVQDKAEFDRILESEKVLQKMTEDFSEFEKLSEELNTQKSKSLELEDKKKSLEERKIEAEKQHLEDLASFAEKISKYLPVEENPYNKRTYYRGTDKIKNKILVIDNEDDRNYSWYLANIEGHMVFVHNDNAREARITEIRDYDKIKGYIGTDAIFSESIIEELQNNLKTFLEQNITLEKQKQNRLLNDVGKIKTDLLKASIENKTLESDFARLDNSLRFNANFEIESAKLGEPVSVFPGSTGKSGLGIRHIIEERFKNDNLSLEEITALTVLVLDSVRNGNITRENDYQAEFTKNGIVAIVRKEFFGNQQNWILTGFAYDKSNLEENREATEAIKTVIANYSNSDGYSYFRSQVGAVIASLNPSITQTIQKSSIQNFVQNNTVYGFAYEGKIYLNPDIMTSEVALHEYTHLWDAYTQRTNPELWQKGKDIFKKTHYWNEVKNDPNYADIADNDDLVLSEVHARICGKMADAILEKIAEREGELTKNTIIDWDKECWHYIASELNVPFKPNLLNELNLSDLQDVNEFLSMTMKDLMNSKQITNNQDHENWEKLEEQFTKSGIKAFRGNFDSIKKEVLEDFKNNENAFTEKEAQEEVVYRLIEEDIDFGVLSDDKDTDEVHSERMVLRSEVLEDIAKKIVSGELTVNNYNEYAEDICLKKAVAPTPHVIFGNTSENAEMLSDYLNKQNNYSITNAEAEAIKRSNAEMLSDYLNKQNNYSITNAEAEAIIDILNYDDYKIYLDKDNKMYIVDVSEDFIGKGELQDSASDLVSVAYYYANKRASDNESYADSNEFKEIKELANNFGYMKPDIQKLNLWIETDAKRTTISAYGIPDFNKTDKVIFESCTINKLPFANEEMLKYVDFQKRCKNTMGIVLPKYTEMLGILSDAILEDSKKVFSADVSKNKELFMKETEFGGFKLITKEEMMNQKKKDRQIPDVPVKAQASENGKSISLDVLSDKNLQKIDVNITINKKAEDIEKVPVRTKRRDNSIER